MKLFNCLYPKIVKNPYSGELLTAKCGKCAACQNARISNWVSRLDMEADCHKYVYFFTLTYNEQNVPQIVRLRKDDYPTPAYLNSETGEIIDISEINATFTNDDRKYIYENKVLNVLQKSDFQKFIKRLRYYFDQTEKGATLRYYLCGEIGPTTYRPHGHCLLFFDSSKCADALPLLLSKSWKYGITYDPHSVSGSAAAYCAAYINGTASLPKVYLHPSLKPFAIFSKSPAIGTLLPNFKDVRQIFEEKPMSFKRFNRSNNTFKDEPFPRSFISRLYPRCQRFGSLSSDDRVELYRLIQKYSPALSAVEIARRLKSEYCDDRRLPFENAGFFQRYFREIAYKKKIGTRLISDKAQVLNEYKNYPFLPSEQVDVPFYAQKTIIKEFCFDSLVRFARTLKRVQHQAQIFHISIDNYVKHIEEYYEKLEKYKLRKDYIFQQEYFRTHPKSDFVFFDYAFYKRVTNTDYECLSGSDKKYLFSFGLKPDDTTGRVSLSMKNHRDYINLRILHEKIAHDLVKQKKNNDYALSHKDKRGNIINFKNV